MFIALGVNFSYPSFVCFHFFLSGVNGFSAFRVIVFIFGFLAGLIREEKTELCMNYVLQVLTTVLSSCLTKNSPGGFCSWCIPLGGWFRYFVV